MVNRLGFIGVLAVMATTALLGAQEVGSPEQPEYKLRVDARLATTDVLVREKHNRTPVTGLAMKDFAVFDNGREERITHFSVVGEDARPLAIVLMLNLWWGYKNNSVQGGDKQIRDRLQEAVRRVVAGLRP